MYDIIIIPTYTAVYTVGGSYVNEFSLSSLTYTY